MNEDEYKTLYDFEDNYWWFRGRRLVSFGILSGYSKHSKSRFKRILDIGMGTGVNLKQLQKLGIVYGCDISRDALNFSRSRGLKNLKICRAEKLGYKANYFDLVTSFGVLECVDNDTASLNEMYRVCKPGGRILIAASAFPQLAKLQVEHDKSQHLKRRYDRKSLRAVVESAGFKIEKMTYFNTLLFPFVVGFRIVKYILTGNRTKLQESKSDLKPLSGFLNEALFWILKIEDRIIRNFGLPFGLTLICLAEKPKITNE